jgi:hypothetical protein
VFVYRAEISANVIPDEGRWFQDNGRPIWVRMGSQA